VLWTWPLTGRTRDMQVVESALSMPGVAGVVICGASGVGKSRLAREVVTAAACRGCVTHWVSGTSSARTLPLGAFSAWAPSDVTDTVQLIRGVVSALTISPSGEPVVVGVDDAHLLDDLSTFVLHQLVQRSLAKLVLTVRDGEHIAIQTQELWRAGHFDRLDLQPLPLDETASLLSATLGGPVDLQSVQRFWDLSRGNVLFLRHVVEREVADGRLRSRENCWRWIGDPIMPCDLVDLIESRIASLPAAVADVLDALAVGEPIELNALRRITGGAAVEEADVRGLITLHHLGGRIDVLVAHPIYGEVRRKCAAPTRLMRLRGLVALELGAANDDDMRVMVRRATLSLESDLAPDAELLAKAAQGAVWLADLSLADRLAEAAIRAGATPEAQFTRAHALSWLSRGDEAEAVLADVPVGRLTDEERARFTYLRASNMLWALGNPARARAIIDETPKLAAGPARNCIDALNAVYWFAMDRPESATLPSKDIALDGLPPIVGTETAWALAAVAAEAGRFTDAVALAEAGYVVATRCFDAPHMRFNIADAHVSALLLAGRIADALKLAESIHEQAAELPGAAQALGAAVAGRAALGAGRLDSAVAHLDAAADALRASGHAVGWGYRYDIPRAIAHAMQGATGIAATTFASVDARRRAFRMLDSERSIAQAWVAAGEGAVTEAIDGVSSAAARARDTGQFAAEVMCLQTATQFGAHSAAERLSELRAIVEGPRVDIATRFAAAIRDNQPDDMVAASKDFETMGDIVAAVDAASQAAIAYRREDLRGSSLSSIARAEALAARCGGANTPALRQAREPLPLTEREREIVSLLGQGLYKRDVAARLTLSVRTVEGHIYRAMTKTGTGSREELAALLPARLS